MSILATISQTGYILITLSIAILSIGLIVLLYFLTRHERRRYKESKLSDLNIRIGKLDDELKDKLTKGNAKSKFNIFAYTFMGVDVVITRYGKAGFAAVVEVLERRIRKALKMPMVICPHGKDRLIVITDKAIAQKKLPELLNKSLESCSQDITMADASVVNMICIVSAVEYPIDGKEFMELLNAMDKTRAVARRGGGNTIAVCNNANVEQEFYAGYSKLSSDIASKNLRVRYRKAIGSDGKIVAVDTAMQYANNEQNAVYLSNTLESGDMLWVEQNCIYNIASKLKKILSINDRALILINPRKLIVEDVKYMSALNNAIKLSGSLADRVVISIDVIDVNGVENAKRIIELYKTVGVKFMLSNLEREISLEQLVDLGAAFIKIDATAGVDEVILSIIEKSKATNSKIVADNVINTADRERLFALGIEFIMGMYVGEYGELSDLGV